MPDLDGFTERLKTLMKERGINQVKLCELTGLSSAQANYLAKGKTKDPKISTACKIAIALDVSLDYLAGLIDEPRPIQRDENGIPVFTDARLERINAQYEDLNERGRKRAVESMEDIHDSARNLKSVSETGMSEAV